MVQPQISAWSSFIVGGLGGWREGGERPPFVGGPPPNLDHGPPPYLPNLNSMHLGSSGTLFGTVPVDIHTVLPPSLTAEAGVVSPATSIYVSTASVAPPANETAVPAQNGSDAACEFPNSPLSNQEQVGKSTWGTLCQRPLQQWINRPDGSKYTAPPWGNLTTRNTDPTIQGDIPVTNITRSYNWTISRSQISPDGVLRDVILVNNQFPGPLLEANYGDWIEVSLHNNISLPEEGTAIHWHGIPQRETPWMDGTPGVAQCPIAPGESYTYRFRAEVYGTTFWHAHYSAQYTAGAVGPMIIHGPSVREYDIDVGPVMLSDWNHIPYFSMVANVVGTDFTKIPPLSDNGLINGRGRFNCSTPSYSNSTEWLGSYFHSKLTWTCVDGAPRSQFRFQSGRTHRLRLINQGADGIQKFSIDNHTMTVIATDFVPTQPYETDVVTLGIGQRTDVLVTAHEDPKTAVWMRTQLPGGPMCGGLGPYDAPVPPLGAPEPPGTVYPDVMAAIYYEDADTRTEPASITTLEPVSCANDDLSLTHPDFVKPASTADAYTLNLFMTLALNETGNFEWRMNNEAYRANFNAPLLFSAAAGQTTFPANPEWNVYDLGANQSIILNVTNATPFTHPMHLHGHTFSVLAVGSNGAVWDGSSIVNPSNPMRRDVQIVPAGGFVALHFAADNPGVWPFHCHVAWHQSSGLAVNLVSRAQDIVNLPEGTRNGTCEAWDRYSSQTVVDQIDSGS